MIVINLFLNLCLYFYLGLITVLTIFPRTIIYIFKKKKQKIIIKRKQLMHDTIIMVLTLSVYFICVFLISRWTVQKLKINYLAKSIIENTEVVEKEEEKIMENIVTNTIETPEQPPHQSQTYYPSEYWKYANVNFIDVDLTDLKKKNSDTVGWIKINNTNVNYPVTQTTDNNYYLKHSFNKAKNNNGWIYGDYRNDFDNFKANSIIYGHNLTDRSMFGSLSWTLKENWYKNPDNLNIKLSTTNSNTVWQIFSIYTTQVESYYLRTLFASSEDYQTFLNEMKSRSIYDFNTDVTTDDKILTLSTCDDSGTKRLVIQAKMIKIEYK